MPGDMSFNSRVHSLGKETVVTGQNGYSLACFLCYTDRPASWLSDRSLDKLVETGVPHVLSISPFQTTCSTILLNKSWLGCWAQMT
jgi:hypothetical protein